MSSDFFENSASIQFEPIGHLQSCYPDKFGTPRQPGLAQHSIAKLKIRPQWQPLDSLQGLSGFSHIWLLFVFHKNSSARYHAKVHPPRLGGQSCGLFATRSPHRPNPIGLSVVRLFKVEKDTLWLRGVDLIDGTPVLDVKPYLKNTECLPEASAGWTQGLEEQISVVEFDWSLAIEKLNMWRDRLTTRELWPSELFSPKDELRQLVEETIALDPRPLIYRGYEGEPADQQKFRATHAVRILDGDIHFEFLSANRVKIFDIHF